MSNENVLLVFLLNELLLSPKNKVGGRHFFSLNKYANEVWSGIIEPEFV